MSSDEGASPVQVLLGASRTNNLDLLTSCLSSSSHSTVPPPPLSSTDSLGNTALHNTAKYGCLECLDYLLDCEVDLDAQNRIDGDTPLHLGVRHSRENPDAGLEIVEFLLDAGASTKIKNKHGELPIDLVGPNNVKVKNALEQGDLTDLMGTDVVDLADIEADSDGE